MFDVELFINLMSEFIKPLVPLIIFSACISIGLTVVRKITKLFEDDYEPPSYEELKTDYIPHYYARTRRRLNRAQRRMMFHRGH